MALLGTHNPGPNPLGKHTIHPRLQGFPAGLSHSGHSPHTPTVSALPLSLPSPTEQVSPNKLLLSPPPVWAGDRHQRAVCKQRQGQNQSGPPGALRANEKRGNRSCSRRCSGLNPHNQPETVNSRGSCGFGEQVQAVVREDLNLSQPHTINNRSRDFPRNTGGLSEWQID